MATAFLPILNLKTSLLQGPPFFIGNNICVKKLENADKSCLYSNWTSQELNSLLKKDTKCIYINNVKDNLSDINTQQIKTILTFLFNYERSCDPIHLPIFILRHDNSKYEIDPLCDSPLVSHKCYILKKDVSRETINGLYKSIDGALSKDIFLINILDRYNLALKRNNIYDKIIDICIALESLCNSSTEISFQFSLYNSWLSTNDPIQRQSNYVLLKELYKTRSNIVHGNSGGGKIRSIERDMGKIFSIAGKCIFYYIFYLDDDKKNRWNSHLQNLAMGVDKLKFY